MLHTEDMISAIGILLGFQFTAFSWRVKRELSFRDKHDVDDLKKRGEKKTVSNAIAPADWLSIASIVLNVLALLLILMGVLPSLCKALFGAGLVLFGTYPFAILAHYRMFVRTDHELTEEYSVPVAEKIILCLGALMALVIGVVIARLPEC